MANPGQELSSIDFAGMLGGPLVAVIDAQTKAALSSVNFIKSVGFNPVDGNGGPGDPIYVAFKYPKLIAPYQAAVGAGDGSLNITLISGGSGYSGSAVTLTFTGGGASTPATATGTVSADGVVTGLNITNVGAGYKTLPKITFPNATIPATIAVSINTAAVPAQVQDMKLEVPILAMLPIPFIRIEETTIDFHAKINSMEYQQVDTNLNVTGSLEVKQRWPGGAAKLNVSASYQRNTTQGSKVDRTYSMDIHIRAVQEEMPAGLEKILDILGNAMLEQPVSLPKALAA
jgi:uncharacterized protein DUF2589